MKYIKKPIPIEAIFLYSKSAKFSPREWDKILPDWFYKAFNDGTISEVTEDGIYIETLEGKMFAPYGNCYIIKGVDGELYPCRADIFEATYEEYDVRKRKNNLGLPPE